MRTSCRRLGRVRNSSFCCGLFLCNLLSSISSSSAYFRPVCFFSIGIESLWTITQLLTTNNEFRKLLHDIVIIIRDIFADLTSTIKPPDHELKRAYGESGYEPQSDN